jgi:hypothetical protein
MANALLDELPTSHPGISLEEFQRCKDGLLEALAEFYTGMARLRTEQQQVDARRWKERLFYTMDNCSNCCMSLYNPQFEWTDYKLCMMQCESTGAGPCQP